MSLFDRRKTVNQCDDEIPTSSRIPFPLHLNLSLSLSLFSSSPSSSSIPSSPTYNQSCSLSSPKNTELPAVTTQILQSSPAPAYQ
uniref:Uncharacterized protein n=1 Tax=Nelumbo nucifera TaxID=4432 RepID=A0A822ZA25_NELNU|nr:TPA_asm: hypothetical protein HUJ06_015743 [Nelumbo nucifera]